MKKLAITIAFISASLLMLAKNHENRGIVYSSTINIYAPLTKLEAAKINDTLSGVKSEKESRELTKQGNNYSNITLQIFPNPINDKATIEINASEAGWLLVHAYAMDGQLIATLYDGECEKGINIVTWIKNGLSNGVYTVKATLGKNITTKKVVTCNGTN